MAVREEKTLHGTGGLLIGKFPDRKKR